MKHLIFLFVAVMFFSLTIKAQSTGDTIVIDCPGGHKIIPYGRSKIFTITDVKLNGKIVTLSYKLENTMTEKPMVIVYYTKDNTYCSSSLYYYGKEAHLYSTMTENEIKFTPAPVLNGLGDVLVRVFLVWEDDFKNPFMAVSNVGSLIMKL